MSSPIERRSVEDHIQELTALLNDVLQHRTTASVSIQDPEVAGRVAADAVQAEMSLPQFDNSQMDGFAVNASDLLDLSNVSAEVSLPLSGVVAAGQSQPQLQPGTAMAVMTGAPIPWGATCVIPVERSLEGAFTSTSFQGTVTFPGLTAKDLQPGTFVRKAGSDVALGDQLLNPGDVLTPARLAVLAACGVTEVRCLERAKVLVISTGDEVRAPGEPLAPGQIYDANSTLMTHILRTFGCEVLTGNISRDSVAEFTSSLAELIATFSPHVVISAGGISKGAFEVVRQSLEEESIRFGSVAQQPGGPQGYGVLASDQFTSQQGQPVGYIALPGNPVSAAVSLHTLVQPALSLCDPACPRPLRLRVEITEALESPGGLRQFRRVRFLPDLPNGVPTVETVGGSSSHLLGHLAQAEALLQLNEEDTFVEPGTIREAILLVGGKHP